jgi:hypothetical protein
MIPVNLTKRVLIDAGLRYCPVVMSSNGRVKPDVVWGNEAEERHTEGAYYIEWYEGSKRKRAQVGKLKQRLPKGPFNSVPLMPGLKPRPTDRIGLSAACKAYGRCVAFLYGFKPIPFDA